MIAWREMLVTSRDRIQKLVSEGKTEQEVLAAKPLADLDAKWAANDDQAKIGRGWSTTRSSGRERVSTRYGSHLN